MSRTLLDPKSPWLSKTLWINGLTVLAAILATVSGMNEQIPAEAMPYIIAGLAAVNFVLRFLTERPVSV